MCRIVWLVLAACSHPPASGGSGASNSKQADGPFRAYVAPAALASPGPATTARKQCLGNEAVITDYEAARERAALDAELRKAGGMLLPAHEDRRYLEGEIQLGAIVRGPAGEHWLVVAATSACGEVYQTVAIDATNEVFVVYPQPKPQRTERVSLCQPDCRRGCGDEKERHIVVAEVPTGAHLGRDRDVPFPIDVQVDADAFAPNGERIECKKHS